MYVAMYANYIVMFDQSWLNDAYIRTYVGSHLFIIIFHIRYICTYVATYVYYYYDTCVHMYSYLDGVL